MSRRSYKTEALKWKNAALDCISVVHQAHFGLDSSGSLTDKQRVEIVASILGDFSKRFEMENPPDDEAGWSRRAV